MGEFFYRNVQVWKSDWDDEMRTVLPQDVKQAALEEESRNPHKRLIIHFIQPHYPFIGETGQTIAHRTVRAGGRIEDNQDDIWSRVRKGDVSKEIAWEAYKENLEIVLPYVEELISSLNGKSVVSADHGNAFGEWFVYGHPAKTYLEKLVQVPWLEVESDERKDIIFEQKENTEPDGSVNDSIQNRLSDLGYLNE